ncbi:3-hydroxyacyl-ACP dehydratase FabZ family protein [Streptomyces sp. NPDC057499]|uniref:3-hydroxyacyl-ACP dehydratase FabZ family protein n=1 Tax=Streptomyces sp. NPDC057499 TaxID=3346150 RepID=UPI00369F785A
MPENRKFSVPLEAIDEIVRVSESGITATKMIHTEEPYLEGHYPDFTIYPGVFIMESVNQTVDAYVARVLGADRIADLVAVMSARFTSPVLPGDTLQVSCQVAVQGDDLAVEANCRTAAGAAAARLKLMYRITGGGTR